MHVYTKRTLLLSLFCLAGWLLAFCPATIEAAQSIRVMTLNLWVGGEAGKQPLSQTLEVIRAAKADLVGLQETRGDKKDGTRPDNGRKLAEMLGWNCFDQGEGTAILSHFPIVTNTPGKRGVSIRLPS